MPQRNPLDAAPDAILAARAADGDATAFEALMRRHGPLMRAYAAKLLRADSEADDVVQDVFIQAWRQLESLNEHAAVRSWLMRMTSRRAIERIRTHKDHADIDDWDAAAPGAENPERIVAVRLQMSALTSVLNSLPEPQRHGWMLKEVGGLSYAEIAELLDVSVPTVRGLLARARKTILYEMEAWR